MERVAVFASPSLRKHLKRADGALDYEFFPPLAASTRDRDLRAYEGALRELWKSATADAERALRRWLPRKPVGSVSLRCDATTLQRSSRLGFAFHLGSWRPGDPPAQEVLAHLHAARTRESGEARRQEVARQLRKTSQRLAILTDIVKTANSI